MAIKTIKVESMSDGFCTSDIRVIQIDDEEDIAHLPKDCDPGSQAYSADMSIFCIMSNSGNWVRVI